MIKFSPGMFKSSSNMNSLVQKTILLTRPALARMFHTWKILTKYIKDCITDRNPWSVKQQHWKSETIVVFTHKPLYWRLAPQGCQ